MIRFANPQFLYLLWLVPLLLIGVYVENRWRWWTLRKWANEKLWQSAIPSAKPERVLLKRILTVAVIGLTIMALTGPQVGTRLVEVTREGSDIAILLDVSQSMLAEDIVPSRVDKAKLEIIRLLDQLHGDRVALVPFAVNAFVQVPLTLDYRAVSVLLKALSPDLMPKQGTSLAEGIKQARKAFRNESKAQRVILLITDAEDHEGGAIVEAKQAAKEGVIIHCIGMASAAGGPIPLKDQRGRVSGYKKDDDGGTIISRLNEPLLKDIASTTGGSFYRATAAGDEFKLLYKTMMGHDKEKFDSKEFTDYEHRFQWLLMLAFILILVEQLIPAGKGRII